MILPWAWSASKQADTRLKLRLQFVLAALRARSVSRRLASANADSPIGRRFGGVSETVGTLLWPYQCAAWDAEMRFSRIAEHLNTVRQVPGLSLAPLEKLVIADLSWISPEVCVIVDRAPWLEREGHLTLIFSRRTSALSRCPFHCVGDTQPALFIGGLQGRQSEDILELYRDLTEASKACGLGTSCSKC